MGKQLKNADVRAYAALNGVTMIALGRTQGISPQRVCDRLNWELADFEKENLCNAIDAIVRERGDEPKRLQRV